MERRESRDHEEPNNKKDSIIKRGAWKPEEDLLLRKYIETYGEGKWTDVSKKSGLMRGAKSCRMRWKNHLRPNIKHGKISEDEEDLIIRMHKLLGNRWSLIAGRIPGRTDNEVKNYWNTHLSKRKLPQQQNRQGDSPTSFNPKKTKPTDTNITKHSTSTRRIGFNDEIRVSAKSTTTSTQPTSITESTRTNTTRIDRSYELDDTEVIYNTERIHQDMFMNNGLDDWSTSIQRTLSPNLAVDFSTLSCEDNGDVLSWWPKWDETIFYDETYCLPSLEEDYSILSVESLERSSEQSWNKNLNWL